MRKRPFGPKRLKLEKKTTGRLLSWRRSHGDASRHTQTAAARETAAPRRYGKFDDFEKSALSREAKKKQRDLGVPLCRGAFTPSTRLVSIRSRDRDAPRRSASRA